jgi:ATP-binding cassette subfamily F protein 3
MNASPLLHLQRISPRSSDQELRNFLGSFGFIGDQALDPVRTFSGGEKARLALALIAWRKPNLLLLDEPTNHLDLEVRHALTLALQGFDGALILVSHDRHLIRNSVDRFLLVADGRVEEFKGDLDDYHQWLAQQRREQDSAAPTPVRESRSASAAQRKEQKRREAEQRARLRPLRQAVERLEKALEQVNAALEQVETALADSAIYEDSEKERLKATLAEQAELVQRQQALEEEWLEQLEALEQLESALNQDA